METLLQNENLNFVLSDSNVFASKRELQELCRTCLRKLDEWRSSSATTNQGTTTLSMKFTYNLENMPQITKLLALITSVNDDNSESYPRSLCQICYDKFLDIQDFRLMIIQSTERLNEIIRKFREKTSPNIEISSHHYNQPAIKSETTNDEFDAQNEQQRSDNHTWQRSQIFHIKNPGVPDIEDVDRVACNLVKTENPSAVQGQPASNSSTHRPTSPVVKIEIDSEFENQADDGDDPSESNFYERNALNTAGALAEDGAERTLENENQRQIADEADFADDEEQSLRSGATNASSNSSKPAHHTIKNLTRKRNNKSLKCPRCDKQVYKKVYLDAHIRAVHEGHAKPFLCSECQKSFTRYNQLHIHIQSNHNVEVEYVCDFSDCKATFKMSQTLETHRKVVHTDGQFSVQLKELELHEKHLYKEMELDNFCQQCNRKYSSKRALNEHVKRHSQIRDHVCKVCGAAKVTRSELSTHMRVHETNLEKFKCNLCPQLFNHKNAISRHVRIVHEGQKKFACAFCPRKFGTQNSKTSHERLHKNEKPFKCEDCSKFFAQEQGLRSHMKNHDKNLRKYVCSFCEKRFITRNNLQYHEERHRGDKPFICDSCNQGFSRMEDLKTHSKQLHDDDGQTAVPSVPLKDQ